jgi:hypothetical protein
MFPMNSTATHADEAFAPLLPQNSPPSPVRKVDLSPDKPSPSRYTSPDEIGHFRIWPQAWMSGVLLPFRGQPSSSAEVIALPRRGPEALVRI